MPVAPPICSRRSVEKDMVESAMKMSGLARPFRNVTNAMFDHATSKVSRLSQMPERASRPKPAQTIRRESTMPMRRPAAMAASRAPRPRGLIASPASSAG